MRNIIIAAAVAALLAPAVATARDFNVGKVKVYADNRAVCDNTPFGQAERRRTITLAREQVELIKARGRKAKLVELWPVMSEACFSASRYPAQYSTKVRRSENESR